MVTYRHIGLALVLGLTITTSALAKALTTESARELVEPFYSYLSNPANKEAAEKARAIFDPSWQSYFSNESSRGLDETISAVARYGDLIPDLNWEIRDIKVAEDTIVVRSEATGTPTGEFFGVPYKGNSFAIMTIDMHTVRDGKIIKTYHVEDWAGALRQLSVSDWQVKPKQD
ncbi:ester cyclase [Vibrio sp. WXL210]|uniref:ester cyclase n=1 Tax=Vibrio sp. WXL210 TaxID=3450709 RepID=UPI003EC598F6